MQATLLYNPGGHDERVYAVGDHVTIGRRRGSEPDTPSRIGLADPTISTNHCTIGRSGAGFYVRDTSRNGTRVNGRRLLPNIDTELASGDAIQVGNHVFRLLAEAELEADATIPVDDLGDVLRPVRESDVSILVASVRPAGSVKQTVDLGRMLQALSRVVPELEAEVRAHGGALKEQQTDGVFGFWEAGPAGRHATAACRAALAVRARALALASTHWTLEQPLQVACAVTTGPVSLATLGQRSRALGMLGDVVNYAFRLVALAGEERGWILTCHTTRALCGDVLPFAALGELSVKGRERAEPVFALAPR